MRDRDHAGTRQRSAAQRRVGGPYVAGRTASGKPVVAVRRHDRGVDLQRHAVPDLDLQPATEHTSPCSPWRPLRAPSSSDWTCAATHPRLRHGGRLEHTLGFRVGSPAPCRGGPVPRWMRVVPPQDTPRRDPTTGQLGDHPGGDHVGLAFNASSARPTAKRRWILAGTTERCCGTTWARWHRRAAGRTNSLTPTPSYHWTSTATMFQCVEAGSTTRSDGTHPLGPLSPKRHRSSTAPMATATPTRDPA